MPKTEDQTTAVSVQTHSSTAVLSSIDQLMRKAETVDVDKLKALYDLHERFLEREQERAFNSALVAAKAEIPILAHTREIVITKDGKSRKQGSYTEYDAMMEIVEPIIGGKGLALTFIIESDAKGVTATPQLRHVDGHTWTGKGSWMPIDTSGFKTGPQALASAQSYAMRYAAKGALNISTREEDDDGNGGAISDEQLAEMKALLESMRADVPAFLRYAQVDALESVRAAHFDRLMAAIRRKQHQPPVTVENLTKPATVATQAGNGPVVETTATVVQREPAAAPDVNALLEQALATATPEEPAPIANPASAPAKAGNLFDKKKN